MSLNQDRTEVKQNGTEVNKASCMYFGKDPLADTSSTKSITMLEED